MTKRREGGQRADHRISVENTHGASRRDIELREMRSAGLEDGPRKRIVAEPFTRYIRGVRPAFLEVSAAYLKASLLFETFDAGRSEIMPYVLGADDVGVRAFADVKREDRVERAFLPLLDRLGLLRFQALVRERFASGGATSVSAALGARSTA